MKEFVAYKVKEYHAPRNGSILFYEENLDAKFGIENGVSFDDHSLLTPGDFMKLFGAMCMLPILYPLAYMDKKSRALLKETKNAMNDLRYTPKLKEIHYRTDLPEPLLMAYESTDEFLRRLTVGRSAHMAEYMFNCGVREVHAIVGLAHEDQIAYFIKGLEKYAASDEEFAISREWNANRENWRVA